jgi:hypothetical protein
MIKNNYLPVYKISRVKWLFLRHRYRITFSAEITRTTDHVLKHGCGAIASINKYVYLTVNKISEIS